MPNRLSRTHAIPLDLYADEAVFEMELADIWHRDWVVATTVDAVADPGSFVPVMIGRQPIIVVRGDDHRLRALANVCSHRGARLVDAPGSTARFTSPYHGWSYDLEGNLVGVPYAMPNEVDHDAHGLASFPVETWHGFVFVCLETDVEPLSERVAAIEPYVRPMGLDRLHHDVPGVSAERWRANWKVVFANAVDSYSNFRVHSETIEPVSPTDGAYYLAGSARSTVTGGESGERADHLIISLPPSFVAIVFPDVMLWMAFRPVDVETTEVVVGMAGEQLDQGSVVGLPGWDAAFLDEDRAICESVQLSAGARWTPGPLLGIERSVADFHDYLRWRLTGHEPEGPAVHARPGERPEPPA